MSSPLTNRPRPLPQPRYLVEPDLVSDAPWAEAGVTTAFHIRVTYRDGSVETIRPSGGFLPNVNLANSYGQTPEGDGAEVEVIEAESVRRERVRVAAE